MWPFSLLHNSSNCGGRHSNGSSATVTTQKDSVPGLADAYYAAACAGVVPSGV
jgi:hypothetical protein